MTSRRPKINAASVAELREESDALVEAIKPILVGEQPIVVVAALSELVALLIAGQDEPMRARVFELHVSTVLDLYPLAVEHFWDGKTPRKEKP